MGGAGGEGGPHYTVSGKGDREQVATCQDEQRTSRCPKVGADVKWGREGALRGLSKWGIQNQTLTLETDTSQAGASWTPSLE